MTASSSGWTPLFLNAEPEEHRRDLVGEGAGAQRALDLLGVTELSSSMYASSTSSSKCEIASISWWWYSCACSTSSAGISVTSNCWPRSSL
jgi:hypothetical protein